jgi:carbamoyltransferase
MNIIGISAFYHDSAAVLVQDGVITAAAQEERFTRIKHDPDFPSNAVRYCLEAGGIGLDDVDYITFYDKPLLKFDRLIETYLAYAPKGFQSFRKAIPVWLKQKVNLSREIRNALGGGNGVPLVYTEHHESHAASAFFPSPFEKAAIITLDGVGEWSTSTIAKGEGNRITILEEQHFPHSLGLLYSAFTYYAGFRVNSGEYKLMGLAPYGEPRFHCLIMENLLDLREDGSFRLNMRYFNYAHGLTMTNVEFEKLFGAPARSAESECTQFYMDIAASIQKVTEEIVLRVARHARKITGMSHLTLAGGVALNCVANGKLIEQGIFDDVWIQPAAGDAGGALGAALLTWYQLLENPRGGSQTDRQSGSLLGPSFGDQEIRTILDGAGAVYHRASSRPELHERLADLITEGKVIGYFQGRMEFGPRALGSRSILGDARSPEMQRTMNVKIKFRESFRPFAPLVMREHAHEYFDVPVGYSSPYMLQVAPIAPGIRVEPKEEAKTGIERVNQIRSTLPAITHVDYSARIQTVDEDHHPELYRLMKAFYQKSGCPVLVNTSFNVRGEPIVGTPADAYRCFMATNMDVLVVEDYLMLKEEQPEAKQHSIDDYLTQFKLD